MKLTSFFIATSALLFIGACSQDGEEVADAAKEAIGAPKDVAETFTTATLINPNTAGADVIAAIPGVDAALAQRVISGRPYATPSALHAVLKDVVDENELRTIYTAMFVTVDLNTGSNADYQLIPTTMSPKRLAHEFEEYRPYSSMEQFSREMSKYFSAEEVAFLQRYVTVN
jgi:radical SAM superfamily enzyme with C-terminal helix-hairpin-helix motif